MIINVADIWKNAAAKHKAYLEDRVKNARPTVLTDAIDIAVFDFIDKNKAAIFSCGEKDLRDTIRDYKNTIESKYQKDDLDKINAKFRKIFNYASFSEKSENLKKNKWCAYAACNEIKYTHCPYCQISEISTFISKNEKKEKSHRPNLDHYYDKARYPFLGVTLGNLVPCCEKCNGSQGKHTADFYQVGHLNPFLDMEEITFEVIPKKNSVLDPYLPHKKYEIAVSSGTSAGKNSITTFGISKKYKSKLQEAYYTKLRLERSVNRKSIIENAIPGFNADIEAAIGYVPLANQYKYTEAGKMKKDLLDRHLANLSTD